MSVDGIRKGLQQASRDGHVDTVELDKIMLQARDGGGLSADERGELLKAADGFDDVTKQRLMRHLSVLSQKNAWVSLESAGTVTKIEGRYADLTVGVKGLSAREGLFDNCFSLKGTAKQDGTVKLKIEGQDLQVAVKKGDTAGQILDKVKAQLPAQVTGLTFGGDVQPWDPALYDGRAATNADTAAHLMLYKPDALGLKPGEKPLRVVVTGYGAFMGITDNPSANMAERLSEAGVKGGIVEYRRLDVTPSAVDDFIKEMRKAPPDVILSMGVTGGQAQVEERPENHLGAAPDGNNVMMPDRPVRAGGKPELHTDLPVDAIDWAASKFGDQRAVFTSKSDPNYSPDRSAYLCNYLGYNLAAEYGENPNTTAGFMHVTKDTPTNQMNAVLEAIVATQLDYRRTHPQ